MGMFDKKSSVGLREKYNHAVQTAKSLHMQGGAEERDGKLYFNGTVKSADEKNQIWNALKTVPDWEKDVVADIKVNAPAAQPAPTTGSQPCRRTIADDQLYRAVGRHAERHREEVSGQRQRIHGHLQRQPGPAQRPGQDQARAGVEDPASLAWRSAVGGQHVDDALNVALGRIA